MRILPISATASLIFSFPIRTQSFSSSSSSSNNKLIVQNKELLLDTFANLKEDEQYDTVLTGLCSKILDTEPAPMDKSKFNSKPLDEPLQLLQEMNARKIPISKRAASSILDAAALQEDTEAMTDVLTLLQRNPARLINRYGSRVPQVTYLPTSTTQVQTRLKKAPVIPSDNRTQEVNSVLTFLGVVGTCLLVGDNAGPFPSFVLFTLTCIAILDNFSDVLKFALTKEQRANIPFVLDEDSWIGSGTITRDVITGWTRLFTRDSERSSQAEAAAFYVGYVLGLPCFPFQPVAKEAATLTTASVGSSKDISSSSALSMEDTQRVLMWLYAPVSYEYSQHAQMMASDPREADSFCKIMQDRYRLNANSNNIDDLMEHDLKRWSYAECEVMWRTDVSCVKNISEGLASGASTVADVIAILEQW